MIYTPRRSFSDLWDGASGRDPAALAHILLSDPSSLVRLRYALLAKFDCAEHPSTYAYWEEAGMLALTLIDGLVGLARDLERAQDERRELYTLGLQIAGRVSLGLAKLEKQDLSTTDRLRTIALIRRCHPGLNGAYAKLAEVYRFVLWHDQRQDDLNTGA